VATGIKEIANGVYYGSFEGGNCGAIVEGDTALLVDTPMLPHESHDWHIALQQLGVKKIHSIVNTDYHPEHLLGNAAFMPARVWGHELTARQIARYKTAFTDQVNNLAHQIDPQLAEKLNGVEITPPSLGVEDRVTLYWPHHEIQILLLDGHTPVSLGVFLLNETILFAGDNVVVNEPPSMTQANSLAWLETLGRLEELAPQTIVPGVGELCSLQRVTQLKHYIGELRSRVVELFQAGASRRECVEKVVLAGYYPVTEDQAVRMRRRQREGVERVYAEVRSELRRK
jgi:glyoxylase-like metal-dependent hydrolase (beta-lactamase superfamily II)